MRCSWASTRRKSRKGEERIRAASSRRDFPDTQRPSDYEVPVRKFARNMGLTMERDYNRGEDEPMPMGQTEVSFRRMDGCRMFTYIAPLVAIRDDKKGCGGGSRNLRLIPSQKSKTKTIEIPTYQTMPHCACRRGSHITGQHFHVGCGTGRHCADRGQSDHWINRDALRREHRRADAIGAR